MRFHWPRSPLLRVSVLDAHRFLLERQQAIQPLINMTGEPGAAAVSFLLRDPADLAAMPVAELRGAAQQLAIVDVIRRFPGVGGAEEGEEGEEEGEEEGKEEGEGEGEEDMECVGSRTWRVGAWVATTHFTRYTSGEKHTSPTQ